MKYHPWILIPCKNLHPCGTECSKNLNVVNYQDSIQTNYLSTNSSFNFVTSRTKKSSGLLVALAPVLPTSLPHSLPTKWAFCTSNAECKGILMENLLGAGKLYKPEMAYKKGIHEQPLLSQHARTQRNNEKATIWSFYIQRSFYNTDAHPDSAAVHEECYRKPRVQFPLPALLTGPLVCRLWSHLRRNGGELRWAGPTWIRHTSTCSRRRMLSCPLICCCELREWSGLQRIVDAWGRLDLRWWQARSQRSIFGRTCIWPDEYEFAASGSEELLICESEGVYRRRDATPTH